MSDTIREDASKGKGGWGTLLCILGVILFAQTFLHLPPKFDSLAASDVQVTRVPYMKVKVSVSNFIDAVQDYRRFGWGLFNWRDYQFPALDLDGTPTWIATAGWSSHVLPQLNGVRAGDRVRVWIDVPSNHVWQVASRDTTFLAYEEIKKHDSRWRHGERFVGFILFLAGVLLAVLKL